MSKIYIFVFALLLSITVFAERPKSGRLTIATYDNAGIRVEIDGRRYSERDNTIRINNINPGHHSIQVYRRNGSSDNFGRSRERERLIYSNSLYVKPEHQVDIYIDRSGRADIRERNLNRKGRDNRKDNWDRDNDRWDDYERWENNNDRNDNRWDRNNDRNDRNDYGRGTSYESFQSMKQALRRESFDNTRLTLAKQMMERNNFEAGQVREMLELFSFESNRLEIAKYAYRNTVDKKNYHVVYDMFSFSSSKEELSRYISNLR